MKHVVSLAFLMAAQMLLSAQASAATCTLRGRVQIQSMDPFYCDTDVLGSTSCTGWGERDLDRTDRPMRHMLMSAHTAAGETLGLAKTDDSGNYVITFTRPTCSLDVVLFEWFARVHEADGATWPPRYRFIITGTSSDVTWSAAYTVAVRNSTTTFDILHRRSTGHPDDASRYANVYYIMNSIVTEAVGWHEVIDQYFRSIDDVFYVRYNPYWDFGDRVLWGAWNRELMISGPYYNFGNLIRHEMGHTLQAVIHGLNLSYTCYRIYTFGGDTSATHGAGCEWAADATHEALASFLGLRTLITGEPTRAWACDCVDNARPDVCSLAVQDMARASDRIAACPGGGNNMGIIGIGDHYVNAMTACTRLRAADGCRNCIGNACYTCTDRSPNDGYCDEPSVWGFRNETNVVRYLWDLVDSGTDSGFDDTNLEMSNIVAALRNMPCSAGSGFGVDGSCNEPSRADAMQCNPASTIGDIPPNVTGTRDSYNARDLHNIMNTGASNELGLNCVGGARD